MFVNLGTERIFCSFTTSLSVSLYREFAFWNEQMCMSFSIAVLRKGIAMKTSVLFVLFLMLVSCHVNTISFEQRDVVYYCDLPYEDQMTVSNNRKDVSWFKKLPDSDQKKLGFVFDTAYVHQFDHIHEFGFYDKAALNMCREFSSLCKMAQLLVPAATNSVSQKVETSFFDKIGAFWFKAKDQKKVVPDHQDLISKIEGGSMDLPSLMDEILLLNITRQAEWRNLCDQIARYGFALRSDLISTQQSNLYVFPVCDDEQVDIDEQVQFLHTFSCLADDTVVDQVALYFGSEQNADKVKSSLQTLTSRYWSFSMFLNRKKVLQCRHNLHLEIKNNNNATIKSYMDWGVRSHHMFLYVFSHLPRMYMLPNSTDLLSQVDQLANEAGSPELNKALGQFLHNYLFMVDALYQHQHRTKEEKLQGFLRRLLIMLPLADLRMMKRQLDVFGIEVISKL